MTENDRTHRKGYYSPNQCLFFVVLALVLLIPFLGKRLSHPAQRINNLSVKNIYLSLVQPLIELTEYFPAAGLIPAARTVFIQAAGLEKRGEWDSFFYHGQQFDIDSERLFAFDDAQNYARSLDGYAGGGLPAELHGQISPQLLRNVALPIPRSSRYPLRMFFFGDSQMHGIASGMLRALGTDTSITVQELSVHSSGFLRSDYYNWPQKLETLFSEQKEKQGFDAAALILGMNDYQDMWTSSGTILYAGTPEWEEVYCRMVKTHLDIVLRSVPRVYWFGLPVVRKSTYNERIRYLDSLHCAIAEEYDNRCLIKVSLKAFVAEYGTDYVGTVQAENGTRFALMQGDGIHYTIEGGEFLMKKFIAQLHQDYEFEKAMN